MRTLCDVCEAAPARFFCAADEAALCPVCDDKVHRCNKLANRHVRVQLAEARAVPHCDICENAPAFFFCGIDGTSLCLQCDLDVHVGGKRSHERYLLLGQRVEFANKRPTIVEDVVLHHINAAKGLKGQQSQRLHQDQLCERFREKMDNGKTHANTMAVNNVDCEQHASMMIDLNSRPLQPQGQASNSCQNMRTVEVVSSSSDDEYGGVLHDIHLKGKDPSECR